eukprot:1164296-Rhodomonas_salina.1
MPAAKSSSSYSSEEWGPWHCREVDTERRPRGSALRAHHQSTTFACGQGLTSPGTTRSAEEPSSTLIVFRPPSCTRGPGPPPAGSTLSQNGRRLVILEVERDPALDSRGLNGDAATRPRFHVTFVAGPALRPSRPPMHPVLKHT